MVGIAIGAPGNAAAAPCPPLSWLPAAAKQPRHRPVLDGDARGVAGDHLRRPPAAGHLHRGRRRAPPHELRGEPSPAGVRRDAREAGPVREGLEPFVDAVRAERDDAVRVDDRALGGAELIERPRKRPHEQPEVLVLGRRVRLRRPDQDAELLGPLGRLDIGPDQRRGLGAPQAPRRTATRRFAASTRARLAAVTAGGGERDETARAAGIPWNGRPGGYTDPLVERGPWGAVSGETATDSLGAGSTPIPRCSPASGAGARRGRNSMSDYYGGRTVR